MTLKIQRLFNPETKALILSDHGHNPWNELVKAHAQQQGITPSTAEEIITNLDLAVVAYHKQIQKNCWQHLPTIRLPI